MWTKPGNGCLRGKNKSFLSSGFKVGILTQKVVLADLAWLRVAERVCFVASGIPEKRGGEGLPVEMPSASCLKQARLWRTSLPAHS